MRIPSWLCSFVVLAAAAAFGQTNTAPPTSQLDASRLIAMTGCVARAHKSGPVALTHAMVLPSGVPVAAQDAVAARDWVTPPLLDPAHLSAGTTQQGLVAQQNRLPAGPGTVGTSGAVGTSGTIVGTAPVGSSASSVDGYQLSGVDMTSWIGRRVQLIGKLIPAGPLPEFRVTSVEAASGPCPR